MINTEQQIDLYLAPFSNKIAGLAQALRAYFRNETQPNYELVGDSTNSLNIGYGLTRKAWDCYCAIIVYSKHINISFPSGAFLEDPHQLLVGTGKRVRHIRIDDIGTVTADQFSALVQKARENALSELSNVGPEKSGIETIIKQISGIKKRPKY